MMEIMTTGELVWDEYNTFEVPVKLIEWETENGCDIEYENVLNTGEKVWWKGGKFTEESVQKMITVYQMAKYEHQKDEYEQST